MHEMTLLLMHVMALLEAAFCAVSAGLIRLNQQGGMRKAPVAQTGPCMLWTMKGMNS